MGITKMQITIELPEDEIQAAIQTIASNSVKSLAENWKVQQDINKRVKELWYDTLDEQILAVLADSEGIKSKVIQEAEKKIQTQINVKMRQLAALKSS